MSVRNIIIEPDPILRKKSKPVDQVDLSVKKLLDEMLKTMYLAPGIGLAAVQVGILRRIVVIDISKESIEMFKIFRSKDLNLNIGISNKNGFQKAYFEKPISTLSSLDKNYLPIVGRKNLIVRDIKVYTLKKLREKYKIKSIDFLKIDCESVDEKIVLNSSLKDLDCKFLCIEIIPESHYNIKNKSDQKYYKHLFLKTKIYRKIKKKFKLIKNIGHTYLLKKI